MPAGYWTFTKKKLSRRKITEMDLRGEETLSSIEQFQTERSILDAFAESGDDEE